MSLALCAKCPCSGVCVCFSPRATNQMLLSGSVSLHIKLTFEITQLNTNRFSLHVFQQAVYSSLHDLGLASLRKEQRQVVEAIIIKCRYVLAVLPTVGWFFIFPFSVTNYQYFEVAVR